MARRPPKDVVASFIEAERIRRGWTYRMLAEEMGESVSMVHGWATGKYSPNLESLERIARFFKTDVAGLLAS